MIPGKNAGAAGDNFPLAQLFVSLARGFLLIPVAHFGWVDANLDTTDRPSNAPEARFPWFVERE